MKPSTNGDRRRWRRIALLLLALLLAAAAILTFAAVRPPAADAPAIARAAARAAPSRIDQAQLDRRIGLLMKDPDMVGFAIGVVEQERVRFIRGYGERMAGSGAPVTPDTVFRWGSVSKGVATALVAKLAAEGRLSLDAPIADLATTLRLPGGPRGVTVAHVLSHRTGLVRNAWDDRLEAGEDPRSLRAAMGGLPLLCPPATCYAYQNIAFDAAAEIVARATGGPYAAAARDRLFAPLGMTGASVGRAGLQTARRWARPHRLARRPTIVNDAYYRVPAAGGVNGSIQDLVTWMRAQMGAAPSVLPPSVLATVHGPRVATPPTGRRSAADRALGDAAYGLGWRSFTYAGRRLVGHRGSVDGYGSLLLFDPAERSGVAMLWNSNRHRAARLQLEVFDMLYGLPFTDWLEGDRPSTTAPPPPPEPARIRSDMSVPG
ncbi:MAG TPA: serine hydrolase domain-containing protein [Sphingomonas sp.]|uniref:serine hydrolase domain-containing protein n=1 Tax=Sphingomonas sp. TaxID=28214 RepID=UPI002ED8758A